MGFNHLSESLREYLAITIANANRWSVVYSDLESIGTWVDAVTFQGATYIRTVPWVRWSMPQLSGDRPPQGAEAIIIFYGNGKGRKHWNGPGNLTHCNHKCMRGEHKHKAEKPLDQALDLVQWFSDPGEIIYDPCAGSGTIGLAALMLGRAYVGIEIDPHWAGIAMGRLQSWEQHKNLGKHDLMRLKRWLEDNEK
jgi:hypothetical protein